MEQKKRRFRPTLTAYRRLEGLLKEAKDALDIQIRAENTQKERIEHLRDKVNLLEKSNELMEQELIRRRDANTALGKINKQLCIELQAIKSRGFWARLFNLNCF